ncbi:MAG TPA: LysM domain-containing protein, partial [Luteimonas sp.]|nr:LysM domain-containing protein [Luteimonas sp.]
RQAPSPTPAADISDAMADASAHLEPPPAPPRTHTVARGDSPWKIARRYGVSVSDLLARNGLGAGAVLRPGMALAIDTVADGVEATGVAE